MDSCDEKCKMIICRHSYEECFPDTAAAVHSDEFGPFGIKVVFEDFYFPVSAYDVHNLSISCANVEKNTVCAKYNFIICGNGIFERT